MAQAEFSQVTISVTIATIIDDMVATRMKRVLLSMACPGAVRSAAISPETAARIKAAYTKGSP